MPSPPSKFTPWTRADAGIFAVLVPYLALVWHYWFVTDDAFISFRYARNLARGHGLRFNLGDALPVEGYSNLLWVLLTAPVELAGGNPAVVMPTLSALCGVALVLLTYATARRVLGVRTGPALVATLMMAMFPPMACWASSGLAPMPFALLMFSSFVALTYGTGPRAPWLAALLGAGLILIRTEGIYWLAVMVPIAGLLRVVEGRDLHRWLTIVGIPTALVATGQLAWRYVTYHALTSNTSIAKVHLDFHGLLAGSRYIAHYFVMGTPLLMALAGLLLLARPDWRRLAPIPLFYAGVLAYSAIVGGDYLPYFRLLVPGIPFGVVCVALVLDRTQLGARGLAVTAVVLGLVAAHPVTHRDLVPQAVRKAIGGRQSRTHEEYIWQRNVRNRGIFQRQGLALKEYCPPDARVVEAALGNVGYFSDLYLYDVYGLIDRDVAQRVRVKRGVAGHEMVVRRNHFLDKKPYLMEGIVLESPLRARAARATLKKWQELNTDGMYYPDLVKLKTLGTPEAPLYFLALRRADSIAQAEAGWLSLKDRYEALRYELPGAE